MKLESSAHQPKMVRRIQLRYALGLLGVAVLLFSWYFLKDFVTDPDLGTVDTTGWIAAIRQTPSGQQVVVLKPDDSVLEGPGYTDGARDQEPLFNYKGDRIFFISDRGQSKSLQLYRWNPAKNRVDQRSSGQLTQEHPALQDDGTQPDALSMLLIKAGVVVDFNPKTGAAHQLVPPVGKSPTEAGGDDKGGMGTQFGPEWEHFGTSFREAHFCKGRKYIVGIMRGDDGETLVIVCLEPSASPTGLDDGLPHGIVKGEHIDMAIDPTGNIVYAVNNFRFINPQAMLTDKNTPPNMIQGGKLIKPYRNMLAILNPDDPKSNGPIARWKVGDSPASQPDAAFMQPRVSPDGKQVLFIYGADTSNGFTPRALMIAPLATGAGASAKPLFVGNVDSPCWSPDNSQVAFVKQNADGTSDILVVPVAGGDPKVLTSGKGSFNSPRFSPMMATKPGS